MQNLCWIQHTNKSLQKINSRNEIKREKSEDNMKRFYVEFKQNLKEKSDFIYVMAYHRDQIVDMLGDEYFIIKVIEKEASGRDGYY